MTRVRKLILTVQANIFQHHRNDSSDRGSETEFDDYGGDVCVYNNNNNNRITRLLCRLFDSRLYRNVPYAVVPTKVFAYRWYRRRRLGLTTRALPMVAATASRVKTSTVTI
jgi:hypothetical protein